MLIQLPWIIMLSISNFERLQPQRKARVLYSNNKEYGLVRFPWQQTMDPEARKALFRARVSQKREKRLDSPLVRYNELDQPVCKVCNVTLKSESLWPAHVSSKKHNEAVEDFKARHSKTANPRSKPDEQLSKAQTQSTGTGIRPSSALPANFFDQREVKKQCQGSESVHQNSEIDKKEKSQGRELSAEASINENTRTSLDNFGEKKNINIKPSNISNASERKETSIDQVGSKGVLQSISPTDSHNVDETEKSNEIEAKKALPEGFFDNKDADLRARGLKPVKYDIKDEMKEFQKIIQEDLQEVDDRLDEEEFDAAEIREEMDLIEQRAYVERVEMLRKKQQEISSAKSSAEVKSLSFMGSDSSDDTSDDDIDEEEALIDWRAKHL